MSSDEEGVFISFDEEGEHDAWDFFLEVVGQSRSGMLVDSFLEDGELARTALSCHRSMDLLCQQDGHSPPPQGEAKRVWRPCFCSVCVTLNVFSFFRTRDAPTFGDFCKVCTRDTGEFFFFSTRSDSTGRTEGDR